MEGYKSCDLPSQRRTSGLLKIVAPARVKLQHTRVQDGALIRSVSGTLATICSVPVSSSSIAAYNGAGLSGGRVYVSKPVY